MPGRASGGCLWCGRRAAYRLGMRPVANGQYGPGAYFYACDHHGAEIHEAMGLVAVDGYPLMENLLEWRTPLPRRKVI